MNTAQITPFEALVKLAARINQNAFKLPEKQARVESWNGIGFMLNGQQFAVQMGEVTEILPVPATTPLPGVYPWVKGLSNVRGRLLAVVDLGEFLGKARHHREPANRIMVIKQGVKQGELSVGVVVDRVQGVVHFSTRQFTDAVPDHLFDEIKPFIVGCYQQDQEYSVFNTQRLVNDARFLKAAKD